ncbi:AlpA family transcriptional regulator [Poseidonocella sp. HB161398]|uniref:helix-turn-helix transcriptional regulator n=1 Tax=Poseidonocella sp. HB161398 TaxID=2320855 RepID=UPI001107FDEA|nr:hypothetical protein [Poseidonocella sp. HB161398]
MTAHPHLAVTDAMAARMIGVTKAEFLAMVESGVMPQPRRLAPGCDRWSVRALQDAVEPPGADSEEFEP